MKEKLKRKYEMNLKVAAVLEKNNSNWSYIDGIKNTLDEFIANNNEIAKLNNEYDKDITAIESEISTKREDLVNIVVPICNVLQVFAYDTNNNELDKKINYHRYKVEKMKNNELIKISKSILKITKNLYDKSLEPTNKILTKIKKTKPIVTKITTYGITDEMVDELKKNYKDFNEVFLTYKIAKTYIKKNENKITEKLKNNNKLLCNKLDKLMTLFEITDKEFYRNYIEARTVIKKDETKKVKKEKFKPENEEKDLEKPLKKTEKEQSAQKSNIKTTIKTSAAQIKKASNSST